MIATDHTAALGPSGGSSSCATARSSFVALGSRDARAEDDPRQYPSHIGIGDDNSFVEREGRHGRRRVVPTPGSEINSSYIART